ncbi:MAG: hypothetical protein HYX87_04570 [Chloroflexi bacterium]|nr:hypothetical protein [Chloroflexota bacterium]
MVWLTIVPGAAGAEAVPVRISSFEISTVDGKSVKDAPLMAGAMYKVQLTIEVGPGIKDKGLLKTGLAISGDRYWTLNGKYSGIDTATWRPGQAELSFEAIEGIVQLQLQGMVPPDFVTADLPNGGQLHTARPISLVRLSLGSGNVLDDRSQEVIDTAIEKYRSTLAAKAAMVDKTTADPRYVDFVTAVMTKAKAEAASGYTEQATEVLQAIPNSDWISPQGSTTLQWILAGVFLLAALFLAFLLMRARADASFVRQQADEQAKKLELLAAKASRTGDTALSNEITRVRQDLEEVGGR